MKCDIREEPAVEFDRRFIDERGYFVQSDEEFFAEMMQHSLQAPPTLPGCIGGRGVKPEA